MKVMYVTMGVFAFHVGGYPWVPILVTYENVTITNVILNHVKGIYNWLFCVQDIQVACSWERESETRLKSALGEV